MSVVATIAELKIIVDTSQVDKATDSLKKLNDASSSVQTSSEGISKGFKETSDSSEKMSSAGNRLVAQAKEMVAVLDKGKVGVLQYRAGLEGVSGVVNPLIKTYQELSSVQKANSDIQKEITRNSTQADTAKYKMIEALKEEIALFGKSKNEITLYRAEQMGVIDAVRPLIEELERLKAAREGADKAGKDGVSERISNKQKELEAIRAEGEALTALIAKQNESGEIQKRISEQRQALAANQEKYESKQQEIAELKGVQEGTRLLAEEKKKAARASKEEQDAFLKLRGEIDPLKKQMEVYYNQLEKIQKLRSQKMSGKGGAGVDLGELDELEKVVNSNIERMNQLGATSGKTAKEINFALRGLPAQFTDIAVSLQGGQKPLTVMLQQGGQLKDMFGGVGQAAKAMGGYIVGLLTPTNLIIAAVGGLALAAYSGSREIETLNKSIIASGKIATVSSGELLNYARASTEMGGTVSSALEAVTQISAETSLAEESIIKITSATVAWSDATGTSIGDIVSDFVKLTKDPVKAVVELDSKYKFLNSTLYENIKALQEAGRTMDATNLATEAMAQTIEDRAILSVASLGTISTAWHNIKAAVVGVIDKTKELGRVEGQNLGIKLQMDRNKALEEFNKVKAREAEGYAVGVHGVRLAQEAYDNAQRSLDAYNRELERSENQPYVSGTIALSDAYDKYQSRVEKATLALNAHNESVRKNVEDNKLSDDQIRENATVLAKLQRELSDAKREEAGIDLITGAREKLELAQEEFGTRVKIGTHQRDYLALQQEFVRIQKQVVEGGVESLTLDEKRKLNNKDELLGLYSKRAELEKQRNTEKLAEKDSKAAARVRVEASEKMLLNMKAQESSLLEQLNTDIRLGKEENSLLKLKRTILELEESSKTRLLTLDEKSILANKDALINQQQKNAELEKSILLKQQEKKLDELGEGLDQTLKSTGSRKEDLAAGRGKSDKQNEILKERNELIREEARALLDARKATNDDDYYAKQEAIIQDHYSKRRSQLDEYYEYEAERQDDWQGGMQAGFQNFLESQADMYAEMAELTQGVLTSLSEGVAESFTQAIMYGEDLRTSLSNLAMTITEQLLKGLIEMGIQFAINAAAEKAGIIGVAATKKAAIISTAAVGDAAAVSSAGVQAAAGATTAAAWSPAALAASIGSFGSAAAIGLAAVIGVMAAFGGFRKGGYTGNAGVDEVAGVVHGKEYVFDAASTARIGIANLENLRSGKGISGQFSNNSGRVTTVESRGGSTINQTINVTGQVDNQTATQIARRAAKRQGIAEARLG